MSGRTNAVKTHFLLADISWNAGEWHYVILTYDQSGTNTVLYLDGQVAASNNIPLILPAGADPATNWFAVGSDVTGMRPMAGSLDEMYTYDYILTADTIAEYYAQLSPFVSPLPTKRGHGGFHTMADGPPGLPGDGGGGTTNTVIPWSPTNMFSPAFRLGIAPPGTNHWNSDSNSIVLIINQTTNDVYQLWSTTNLASPINWKLEQTLIGNPTTNWTAFIVSMLGRGPQAFFKAIDITQDSKGEGIPDWWQIKYFGTNWVDPYGDFKGDGYSNLYKYINGMIPTNFYQPPAPAGFTASMNTNGNVSLSWLPATNLPSTGAGAVTGYLLSGWYNTSYSNVTVTVSASQTNYSDALAADGQLQDFFACLTNPYAYASVPPTYSLQIIYTNATSHPAFTGFSASTSDPASQINPELYTQAFVTRGPGGSLNLVASALPAGVTAIRVYYSTDSNQADYPHSSPYLPPSQPLNIADAFVDIPVGNFANGVAVLSAAQIPLYGGYQFVLQPRGANGTVGPPTVSVTGYASMAFSPVLWNIPFMDGRTQIAQNIAFLLRAANEDSSFFFYVLDAAGDIGLVGWPDDYIYAGIHSPAMPYISMNEFAPFEDNYMLRNIVPSSANLTTSGGLAGTYIGMDGFTYQGIFITNRPPSYFDTHNYVAGANHTNILAVLAASTSQWIMDPGASASPASGYFYGADADVLSTGGYHMAGGIGNIFGLSYASALYAWGNAGQQETITAGGPSVGEQNGIFYPGTIQPQLRTVGYYFARPALSEPIPSEGEPNFSLTNTTKTPFIASFGVPLAVSAWAKQTITNGFTNVFAYAEQYFDKAFLADTNGNPTATQTGILSEYGDFFPTQPGQVILTTKPDGATGATGQVTINVIKLQLDVNHDGTMDTTFAGPDNTSAAHPFVFWVNNDYDRWNAVDCGAGGIGCDSEQDDLQVGFSAGIMPGPTPDCNYVNEENVRIIPCARDLEDFARLWTAGVSSNLMASLPTNGTVTLSWGDVGSPNPANPTIDLFAAADPDGGATYLTDGDMATNQIGYSPYVGRLGPGQSIVLNACNAGSCWRGSYFIWCGVSNGTGSLTLTISDAGANILARTTASIQLLDIKQMYERWSVGDGPAVAPVNTAYLAANGLPPGATRFLYGPPLGTNTPYILHVHGSNMKLWEKDRFAETMFKRLYWQGYQGRFGSFRWPTDGGFTGSVSDLVANPAFFDKIELTAWNSAPGLKKLLTALNGTYPGQVRLSSHSMGNVVAGEALKQSTNGTVVSVYASFQGAVPSHSYDAGATNRALPGGDDAGEPDTHAHYWTSNSPPYFYGVGGAATYVNYFNANDNVLNIWNTDQNLKPDSSLHYAFTVTNGYYKLGTNPPGSYIDLGFPTNTYELFAFCVPARCYALGAQSNVAGAFLTSGQVDLFAAPYSFGPAHKGHSAEFRSDNMNRAVFWNQLMTTFKLRPTQ